MVEVVTIGETMIRLSPKNFLRIAQSTEMDFRIGGAESNFAIALSRLGIHTIWISKLTNNFLGKFIENEIRKWGVDTSRIIWTEDYRVGIYFIEFGCEPRPHKVIYDRKNSAVSNINEKEIDWDFISDQDLIHLTGITPALSKSCESVVNKAIRLMKENNKLVSFDINYRSKLWDPKEARKSFDKYLHMVDVLFITQDDAKLIFNLEDSPEEVTKSLMKEYSNKVVVMTLGKEGALALDQNGKLHHRKSYDVFEVDRVGAGDAFDAGFIYGYLRNRVAEGLSYAVAMASLKFSIPGDLAIINIEEIEDLLGNKKKTIRR